MKLYWNEKSSDFAIDFRRTLAVEEIRHKTTRQSIKIEGITHLTEILSSTNKTNRETNENEHNITYLATPRDRNQKMGL